MLPMVAIKPSRARPPWLHAGVACRDSITTLTLRLDGPMADEDAESVALYHHALGCGCDLAAFRGAILFEDRRN
jgi:hypothetical protein